MRRFQNGGTQPFKTQEIFNNWDVVTQGWYLIAKQSAVRKRRVQAFELCGQRIVIFRGQDGRLRCLDSFCPHMGTDLAIGRVSGNELRCFFHHWKFTGDGQCSNIPCGEKTPQRARLQSYDVREKYGFIWVWPDSRAAGPVPEYPELDGQDVYAIPGRRYTRNCHLTVNMINGLDAQHLRTVHKISIDMQLKTRNEAEGRIIEFQMEGPIPQGSRIQTLFHRVLDGRYAYSMRYIDATIGMLRTLEQVRWFGKFTAEPTRMIFAYTPLSPGKTQVQPIFIACKPSSFLGRFKAYGLLAAMAVGFFWLRDEDGKVYDNIRFQPNALLKIDQGVARFIQYVNQLRLSQWSTTGNYPQPSRERNHDLVSS